MSCGVEKLDHSAFIIGEYAVEKKKDVCVLSLLIKDHRSQEDLLHNPKTTEVYFSVAHGGCDSPSSAEHNPELNQLMCGTVA